MQRQLEWCPHSRLYFVFPLNLINIILQGSSSKNNKIISQMETELQNRHAGKIREIGGEVTSKNYAVVLRELQNRFSLKLFTSEAVYEFLVHIIVFA